MDSPIAFSRQFSRKMLILAVCVGIIISLSLPIPYYLLTAAEREQNSRVRSELMAESISNAIRDNEEFWHYDIPRFIEVGHRLPKQDQVVSMRVLDTDRNILFEKVLRPARGATYRSRSPILFNARTYGYLEIEEDTYELFMMAGLALIFFVMLGTILGAVIFHYPVKMVKKSEKLALRVVGELQESRQQLRELAIIDGKTQIYNATHVSELLAEMIVRAQLVEEPLFVAMVDIDHFKKFNDCHGHVAGDKILLQVCGVLRKSIRSSDVLGRFGGEEFLLIFPNTGLEKAETIAERLRLMMAETLFEGEQTLPGKKLTVSIGLAGLDSRMTAAELVNYADRAMYMAKESGRNQLCVFHDGAYYIDRKEMVSFGDLSFHHKTFEELMEAIHFAEKATIYNNQISSLITILKTLDSRGTETAQHSFVVNRVAMAVGQALNLPEQELLQLNWGPLLHDIGKLGISDHMLLKAGLLTQEEYEIVKRHPRVGYDLVKHNEYLTTAGAIVLCHHEKWDGSGYPGQLAGAQIPLLARICCVADTVAAMAEDRPYRRASTTDQIVSELRRCAGSQFDPDVVETFIQLQNKEELIFFQTDQWVEA